jgi:hypothetical protein
MSVEGLGMSIWRPGMTNLCFPEDAVGVRMTVIGLRMTAINHKITADELAMTMERVGMTV